MTVWNWIKACAVAIACFGVALAPLAPANPPATRAASLQAHDVALNEGGLLIGRVVDQQGQGHAGVTVSIRQGEHEIVQATADENGVFAARGLRGGQYTLATDKGVSHCRLWAPHTAPPGAMQNAVVVCGDEVARGQFGYMHGQSHAWIEWMRAHPYITGGTIAAAIAIPLAFADDDSGPSS